MVEVLGLNAYAVTSAPQAYDIVRVAFPYTEMPGEPGPKCRPGLVLSVSAHVERSTNIPYATVQVAYGTSSGYSRTVNRAGPENVLRVHNYTALQRSGLSQDTYFVLSKNQKLMWCEEFFPQIEEWNTPIMGKLPRDHVFTLQKLKEIRDSRRR